MVARTGRGSGVSYWKLVAECTDHLFKEKAVQCSYSLPSVWPWPCWPCQAGHCPSLTGCPLRQFTDHHIMPQVRWKMQQPFGCSGHDAISASSATSSRHSVLGWESLISARHAATRCKEVAGGGGNAVGQQLLSITGVSEVAVVTQGTVSHQPQPSRAPADAIPPWAAWPAVGGLANSRGSRRLAEPEALETPPSIGLLFRSPWLLLGRSQVMREGLAAAL